MSDFRSNHSRKPRHDIRAAILANSLLPLGKREPAEALAERFGVKIQSIYQTTIRMRKRGLIGPVGGRDPKQPNQRKIDTPEGQIFDLGDIPDRNQRRLVLANIISVGSNSDRQTAITTLNKMDEADATNDSPDVPTTRSGKVDVIYRILLACPPDILEEALARRQRDLTAPPPGESAIPAEETAPQPETESIFTSPAEENVPENAGLPSGGGNLA